MKKSVTEKELKGVIGKSIKKILSEAKSQQEIEGLADEYVVIDKPENMDDKFYDWMVRFAKLWFKVGYKASQTHNEIDNLDL